MKKILIIGMADSVHLANWLQNMTSLSVEVTLVSSSPHRRIHPKIVELLNRSGQSGLTIRMPNWSRNFGLLFWMLDRVLSDRLRGLLVRRLILSLKPDLVHAIEFQHAGYVLMRAFAKPLSQVMPKIMLSNYGSDIFWYEQFRWHRKKIQSLLNLATVYTAECSRDLTLAKQLGFSGRMISIPNSGGIDENLLESRQGLEPSSNRRIVVLKGYHGKFGRALNGVWALWEERKSLAGYSVVSVSTNLVTALSLFLLRIATGLDVRFHLKGALSHAKVLELMSKARLYIGLSRSDGISTSVLEAMAMGAFPIQTGTSCANEWFSEGKTGVSVSLRDRPRIRAWVRTALAKDELVDSAQIKNLQTVLTLYSRKVMRSRVLDVYQSLLP
jgi:hypothetical protein